MYLKTRVWNIHITGQYNLLGKHDLRVVPLNHFADFDFPKILGEHCLEDGCVKLSGLPPSQGYMLVLDLNDRQDPSGQIPDNPIRLTPSPFTFIEELYPRTGEIVLAIKVLQILMDFLFIADTFCPAAPVLAFLKIRWNAEVR